MLNGDSGDEENDELMCVRSDESDKSLWSVGRRRQDSLEFLKRGKHTK